MKHKYVWIITHQPDTKSNPKFPVIIIIMYIVCVYAVSLKCSQPLHRYFAVCLCSARQLNDLNQGCFCQISSANVRLFGR